MLPYLILSILLAIASAFLLSRLYRIRKAKVEAGEKWMTPKRVGLLVGLGILISGCLYTFRNWYLDGAELSLQDRLFSLFWVGITVIGLSLILRGWARRWV